VVRQVRTDVSEEPVTSLLKVNGGAVTLSRNAVTRLCVISIEDYSTIAGNNFMKMISVR
jgi:hypothetical protein